MVVGDLALPRERLHEVPGLLCAPGALAAAAGFLKEVELEDLLRGSLDDRPDSLLRCLAGFDAAGEEF